MPVIGTKGAASAQGFGLTLGGAEPVYIEQIFSTWLYQGNSSTQTITNGIDLAGKGGLVWIKNRADNTGHCLTDTVNGAGKFLSSETTTALTTSTDGTSAFYSNGFQVSFGGAGRTNEARVGSGYASWTFREQPKFFDVVTWTGDGTSSRAIPHSLSATVGAIHVKSTSAVMDWKAWHRSNSYLAGTAATPDCILALNSTGGNGALYSELVYFPTLPTTTSFYVGSANNTNGATYVAYLFAHNAGGFGLTGTDNVISCGSFTGDGSGVANVTLGYEPQWILFKPASTGGAWQLLDTMRGWSNPPAPDTGSAFLFPNTSDAETSLSVADGGLSINATGFGMNANDGNHRDQTFIYIAIRRGPMKVPTTGTSVYNAVTWTGDTTTPTQTRSLGGIGSPTDLFIGSERDPGFNQNYFYDRLRGTNSAGGLLLVSSLTTSEATNSPTYGQYSFAQQNGITLGNYTLNYLSRTYVGWQFRRAPGFFDEICYTGTGTTNNAAHNLQAVPELIIAKSRSLGSSTYGWAVTYGAPTSATSWSSASSGLSTDLAAGLSNYNYGAGAWTSTTVNVNTLLGYSNDSGETYVAYLFASCPGVSKVGTYTGTGATQVINCGFTGGARFVLVKATSTTGNWLVWDSARGIVAGNDPYLALNSTAAEVTGTDWVDTAATGFELSNSGGNLANSNGVTYIFLAIA